MNSFNYPSNFHLSNLDYKLVSFDKQTLLIFPDDDNVQGVCQEGEELLHGDLDLDQVLCVRLPPAPPALGAQWGHRLLL